MSRPIPYEVALARGDVQATEVIHKFGAAPDFDIGDGFVTIWDGANDAGLDQMDYVFSSSAAIDTISSSSGSDTEPIEIQGLDEDYVESTQTITLTGQTKATLTTALIRIYRMKNVGTSDLVGTVYCYEDTPIVAGVPTDTTKVRAVVTIGNNQTLMAVYTIPAGCNGYLTDFYAGLAAASFPTSPISLANLKVRPFGQVFQIKNQFSAISVGSSFVPIVYKIPEVITEKSDIILEANTSVDISGVVGGFNIILVRDA